MTPASGTPFVLVTRPRSRGGCGVAVGVGGAVMLATTVALDGGLPVGETVTVATPDGAVVGVGMTDGAALAVETADGDAEAAVVAVAGTVGLAAGDWPSVAVGALVCVGGSATVGVRVDAAPVDARVAVGAPLYPPPLPFPQPLASSSTSTAVPCAIIRLIVPPKSYSTGIKQFA